MEVLMRWQEGFPAVLRTVPGRPRETAAGPAPAWRWLVPGWPRPAPAWRPVPAWAAAVGVARAGAADYTWDVPDDRRTSLRAEQVAQTRAALLAAGRLLFGRDGYAATSVEDLAREARVTTGALYHHFATKAMLFEAVFEEAHAELMAASMKAAEGATSGTEILTRGFESFLDAVLQPDLQRIIIIDAPAVLGLARFTELDERYAFASIVAVLKLAVDAGELRVDDPETVTRLLLGAMTRGAMLIANSPEPRETRNAVAAALRALFSGLAAPGT
jgi:AcrR family transcriptional regulator